ncbi:hypothetical protein M0Q50_02380 [bacterium]|jgi:hypothetical protein|nr:hypothetical protein [bacterium]
MNNKITKVIDKWEITSLPKYTFVEKMMKKYLNLRYNSFSNDPKHICDDIEIWERIEDEFNIGYLQMIKFIPKMTNKYFDVYDYKNISSDNNI